MVIANNPPRMIATNMETGKVAWETPDGGLFDPSGRAAIRYMASGISARALAW
jgi:hypothetical protein